MHAVRLAPCVGTRPFSSREWSAAHAPFYVETVTRKWKSGNVWRTGHSRTSCKDTGTGQALEKTEGPKQSVEWFDVSLMATQQIVDDFSCEIYFLDTFMANAHAKTE